MCCCSTSIADDKCKNCFELCLLLPPLSLVVFVPSYLQMHIILKYYAVTLLLLLLQRQEAERDVDDEGFLTHANTLCAVGFLFFLFF